MKRFLFALAAILFFAFANAQVAFVPPPEQQEEIQKRADLTTRELLKKEGYLEHKSFAFNRENDYTMYVEFVSATGQRYTIAAVFASWVIDEDGGGFIELFKDSIIEGYPALTFSISEQPFFWKQLRVK